MVLCLSLVDRTACQHREVLEATKSNIAAAQKKQKEHYGRKHNRPGTYQVGTKVLMKDQEEAERRETGSKVYSITKCLSKGLYALKTVDNP